MTLGSSDKKDMKAVGIVAGTTTLITVLVAAISQKTAKAVSTTKVSLESNPIPTILSIDGKEVETPAKIQLSPGLHMFAAVPKSPSNVWITYGFDKWQVNGVTVSYNPTAQINIPLNATVIAQFMLIDVTEGAPAAPDSLPNPNGPMTPPLSNPIYDLPVIEI